VVTVVMMGPARHISAVDRAGLREINQGDRLQYEVEVDKRNGRRCAANLNLGSKEHSNAFQQKDCRQRRPLWRNGDYPLSDK
jgi:hypothetical protein